MSRKHHHGRPWSPMEDAELKRLASNGRTMEQAAHVIGRSLQSLKGRAKYTGVSFGGRGGKSATHLKAYADWPIDEETPPVSDDGYVEDVLQFGGFPRVEMVKGQPVWIWPAPMRIAA